MKTIIEYLLLCLMMLTGADCLVSCSSDDEEDDDVAATQPVEPKDDWGTFKGNAFVATGSAVDVTCTTGVIQCSLNSTYVGGYSNKGVELSTDGSDFPTNWTTPSAISPNNTFTVKVTHLEPYKSYYYRAYAEIGGQRYLGETRSFVTPQPVPVTSGYVDVGTGELWAACNLNCSKPSDLGNDVFWRSNSLTAQDVRRLAGWHDGYEYFGGREDYDIITQKLGREYYLPDYRETWRLLFNPYGSHYHGQMTYNGVKGYVFCNWEDGNQVLFIPCAKYLTSTFYNMDFYDWGNVFLVLADIKDGEGLTESWSEICYYERDKTATYYDSESSLKAKVRFIKRK